MNRKIELKYLRLDRIPRDSTIAIVAKRRSGKSTLIRNILYEMNPNRVVAFIGSESGTAYYSQFISPLYIHTTWDPQIIQAIIDHQRTYFDGDPRKILAIVIDDWGFDKVVMKSKELRELMQNGRHIGVQVIIAVQFLRSIPFENRGNFDIICVLRENNKNNQKILHEECFSVFDTLADFRRVLQQTTDNFGVLVQDNTSRQTGIEHCVRYYKANENLAPFTVGDPKGKEVNDNFLKNEFKQHSPDIEEKQNNRSSNSPISRSSNMKEYDPKRRYQKHSTVHHQKPRSGSSTIEITI